MGFNYYNEIRDIRMSYKMTGKFLQGDTPARWLVGYPRDN